MLTNPLKNILLTKFLNFRLKILQGQERIYDFSSELKKVEKILVILPSTEEYTSTMQNFVKRLAEIFEKARVSTFISSSLRKTDISWLGVPNEQYLKIIRDEHFDLVVDVNINQDRICAYICALSGAPMRLNLASGEYDFVYNLQFRANLQKQLDEQLNNIISYFIFLKNQN
jgi:hypothetical protein